MIRSRIFQKLFATYVFIILFCTVIIGLMIARQMQHDGLVEIEKSLNSQAIIIRESILPALLTGQAVDLQDRIMQISQGIDLRITIISEDGTVLADSQQDPAMMDNHLDRPEIIQAYATGSGVVTRFSDTLSKPMRYLAMPIDNAHHEYGVIRVALPLSHIDQRLGHMQNVVIVAASLTGFIALILGFWIARSFAAPLGRMTEMARQLSEGDYRQRLELDRQDEMGELARALNIFAETAGQREAVRTDFIANASHELKTPVTAIQGISETLIEDERMDPDTRQRFINKIGEQSKRLAILVADLLALSRLEADVPELLERVDLNEIIIDSCNELQPFADKKNLLLHVQCPETKVHIQGDEKSLGQLMVNLIDNAIKYTSEGGQVTVCLKTNNDQAIIEIEDNGIGIVPAEQQRIFERFYRVDKARSKTLGGTGLGLAIVKHIVIRHQGRIALESAPGIGSLFRVTLPLDNS